MNTNSEIGAANPVEQLNQHEIECVNGGHRIKGGYVNQIKHILKDHGPIRPLLPPRPRY